MNYLVKYFEPIKHFPVSTRPQFKRGNISPVAHPGGTRVWPQLAWLSLSTISSGTPDVGGQSPAWPARPVAPGSSSAWRVPCRSLPASPVFAGILSIFLWMFGWPTIPPLSLQSSAIKSSGEAVCQGRRCGWCGNSVNRTLSSPAWTEETRTILPGVCLLPANTDEFNGAP